MQIKISDEAKDIILKLVCKDSTIRLGTKGGVDEILSHPWFAEINLDDMMNKRLVPPYKPEVKSDEELVLSFSTKENPSAVQTKITLAQKDVIKAHNDDFKGFTSSKM